jgi:hypothetical protein
MKSTSLVPTSSAITPFDPFVVSTESLLVVAFPKSNSKNFPFALALAQSAAKYAFFSFMGKDMHMAAFSRTEADAGRAVAVLSYISNWKGALIFSRGKMLQSSYQIAGVVDCYLKSCACKDYRAHCHRIIDDPSLEKSYNTSMSFTISLVERPRMTKTVFIDRYSFPCKYLFPYFHVQRDHPSRIEDQIQAAGAQQSCHICPNFNADDFVKVGQRSEQRDAFE